MLVMDTTVDFFITKNNDLKVYRKNPKILYKISTTVHFKRRNNYYSGKIINKRKKILKKQRL